MTSLAAPVTSPSLWFFSTFLRNFEELGAFPLGDFTGWRRCCQHPQHCEVGALLALSAAQVPDTLCNTGWHFLGFPLHFLMSFMLRAFNFNENTKLSRACFVIKLLAHRLVLLKGNFCLFIHEVSMPTKHCDTPISPAQPTCLFRPVISPSFSQEPWHRTAGCDFPLECP